MTVIEDRLREAFEAAAHTVPADELAPFTVPARRGRVSMWAVPLAAVAALLLVVALVTTLGERMTDHKTRPSTIGVLPRHILTVHENNTAAVRDLSGRRLSAVPHVAGEYVAVAAAPGGVFYLLTRAGPCGVMVYRTVVGADGHAARPVPQPGGPITVSPDDATVSVSPDGKRLAISGTCETTYRATVLDPRNGTKRVWSGHTTAYSGYLAAWSPDGKTLAVPYWDVRGDIEKAPLLLLDVRNEPIKARPLRALGLGDEIPGGRIDSVVYAPDGRSIYALSGAGDPLIARISVETGKVIAPPIKLPEDFAGNIKADASGENWLLVGSGRVAHFTKDGYTRLKSDGEFADAAW